MAVMLLVPMVISYLIIKGTTGHFLQGRPDYKYISGAGGYFKLHQVPSSFNEARLRCYYEGGVLASPINKAMTESMTAVMADLNCSGFVLTGIHSQFSSEDFVSVEGVPLYKMDLKWAVDEPNSDEEDCIVMTIDGEIADYQCNSRHPYICFVQESTNTSVNICDTWDEAYQYEARTGSCYKVHTQGRTWSRAFMACQAEGAHLAIINSDEEAKVIKELLEANPASSIQAEYTHVASIGFLEWGDQRTWWTIHGEELTKAGYSIWDENSPDSPGSQLCGGINRSGKLNDIWCRNHTFPLICELPMLNRFPSLDFYTPK